MIGEWYETGKKREKQNEKHEKQIPWSELSLWL